MIQKIPIYIPTFINSQDYTPTRVLPHVYFFNGTIGCEQYYIQDETGFARAQNAFPYFDHYNVVTGQFPTTNSKSLLFNNETPVYGESPNQSLYTTYWETYIQLLYNPKTRLVNAKAIIPLADYVKMELNDVVNFRGNYFHLRAINDYSLKTGECTIQLLGPIISNTISEDPPTPPPPTPYATASIYLNEFNSSSVFIDANLIVAGTPYYFSGQFEQSISGGLVADVVMEGKDGGSTNWGSYTTASATLTILDNGTPVTSSTQLIYSGSGDTVITVPTTFTAGHTITISGSSTLVGAPTPPPTESIDLAWSFTESGGARGQMDLYVNGDIVETRSITSTGTYTVYVGDTINVEVSADDCGAPNNYSNAYCTGIISDADCQEDGLAGIFTSAYTVVSGDIGTTLELDCFAACDSGCI
jgi:hypothetical protein